MATSIRSGPRAVELQPLKAPEKETSSGGSTVSTVETAVLTSLTALGIFSQLGEHLGSVAEKVDSTVSSAADLAGVVLGDDYLGAIVDKAKKAASVLTVAAGYISGATNLITGAFEAYWLVKKSQFHKKIAKGLDSAQTTEGKAHAIWKVYASFLAIDESAINKKMAKLESKDLKGRVKDLDKAYKEEVNGWGDYFGNILYGIKAGVHKMFGREYALKNLIQERHDAVTADRAAFAEKLSSPDLTDEQKLVLVTEKKREILVKRAERSQVAALEKIVSPAFAHELQANKDNIDLTKEFHQKALIELHGRVSANYKTNFKADVIECIGHIALGALSIVSMAFVKTMVIKVLISIISTAVSARTVYKTTNAIRRLFGAELPMTFAEETSKLFEAFKDRQVEVVQISTEDLTAA